MNLNMLMLYYMYTRIRYEPGVIPTHVQSQCPHRVRIIGF